jgi:hypothetical protein
MASKLYELPTQLGLACASAAAVLRHSRAPPKETATRACFSGEWGYFSTMSKIEEIELAVEQLPLSEFVKLAGWVDRRRQQLERIQPGTGSHPAMVRDHGAFLNSYTAQDEGLYDDAVAG